REDNADDSVTKYLKAMKTRPQQWSSLQRRHEVLLYEWLLFAPDLPIKDDKRRFAPEQRLAIYRRDKGICQICKESVGFLSFHADYIVPLSEGGTTTVANGRTTHKLCTAEVASKKMSGSEKKPVS
ncbi:MAG: HNH endonuclease signature motif containing protein, partial [Chloroflexota bacterium]